LSALDCSEVGVGGSDNFFENVKLLLIVDFDESWVVNICCAVLFDDNACGLLFEICCAVLFDDNVCGLLFDISCCCIECATITDSNCGCPGDGLPVGKFPNENRGTFADG
jgi:hypothetical protein